MGNQAGSGTRKSRWHVHHRKPVLRTRWLSVWQDQVTRPDGARDVYDHVQLPESVTILALNEHGEVPVTRQWIYTHRKRKWRLPAGGVDNADRGPVEAARRELAEETGLLADRWESLGRVHGADSATNNCDHVYLATGLTSGRARLEAGEKDLTVHWLPFQKVVDMVLDGRLTHAGSAFAVLTQAMRRLSGAGPRLSGQPA